MGCRGRTCTGSLVDVDAVERIEDVLVVMILDNVGRPLGEVETEGVGVDAPSWSSSSSPSLSCGRSSVERVDAVLVDGDLRWPCARAFAVAPVRTLVILAESGVSFESGRSLAREMVLWLRTRAEGVRVVVLRATLRIEPPELARFPSRDFDVGIVRERTDARREWTESVSESVSPDPRIKDGRSARDRCGFRSV